MTEPQFDQTSMSQAAQKIDAAYMDQLMNMVVKFAIEGGKELGLSDRQVMNVLASSCALVAVNINKPKDCAPERFNEAMREAIPRLYDAMFSTVDWFDRRMPWRMQSTHMKRTQSRVLSDLNQAGERKFDA